MNPVIVQFTNQPVLDVSAKEDLSASRSDVSVGEGYSYTVDMGIRPSARRDDC